ncbi:DinB family protein [Fodinibius halophilus]|uniref:DinB family protein n=1 Tax=Fodinibius halophilus TaxID=1736908 RepID=A0A6M1SYZ0_9BACT|nr:DinB family protein [Fodinibius halophilus]NGP89098.1 DinB family protein [Fodinibius halophilus]
MEKNTLRQKLKASSDSLLHTISTFPDSEFNTEPPEGGWSAGQVAEHLVKVEGGTVRVLTSEGQKADRAPEQYIPIMKKRLLDFESKMQATKPIVPDDQSKDKEDILATLQDIRQRMTSLIETQDLTQRAVAFEHPIFGYLTRVEWIVFVIYHSQRHLYQIKELAKGAGPK